MKRNRHGGYALAYVFASFAVVASANPQVVRPDRLHERGPVLQRLIFPLAFRAHWSVDLRNCGQPATDDSQLWITAKSFNFYETNGAVTRIAVQNASRIVATVKSEGEGMTFIAKERLTLSPDRRSLTVRDEDDTGSTTFNRCSDKKTKPIFIPHHMMPSR